MMEYYLARSDPFRYIILNEDEHEETHDLNAGTRNADGGNGT